jgi:hypothetical protein
LACQHDGLTEGKEYVAVDDNTIYDDYGVRVRIYDDVCKFTEVKSVQLPAKLIHSAKQACNQKINEAIRDFEKETGLLVSDIEYNKRTVFNCTETSLSIIISL